MNTEQIDVEELLELARLGLELGEVENALRYYRQVLELDPDNAEAKDALRGVYRPASRQTPPIPVPPPPRPTPVSEPTPTPTEEPPLPVSFPISAEWSLLAGSIMVVAGSLLPWYTIHGPFIGSVTKTGLEGDAIITLGLGLSALADYMLAALKSSRLHPRFLVALGLLCLITVAVDIWYPLLRFTDVQESEVMWGKAFSLSFGPGLLAVGIGGLLLVVGGWTMHNKRVKGQA